MIRRLWRLIFDPQPRRQPTRLAPTLAQLTPWTTPDNDLTTVTVVLADLPGLPAVLIVLHPQPLSEVGAAFRSKSGRLRAPAADKFRAELPDGERLPPHRSPMLETARALQGRGVPGDTLLEFQHVGSPIIAARGRLSELARWVITEADRGGLTKRLWQPFVPWTDNDPE